MLQTRGKVKKKNTWDKKNYMLGITQDSKLLLAFS